MARVAAAVVAVAAVLAVPSLALACENHGEQQAVGEVKGADALALQKEKKATFIDANNVETRQKYGVIPESVLLTSSEKFDAAKELPAQKDRKLVFYCGSTKCTAAEKAAKKAMGAGYSDVNVYRDGIKGWKEAGYPTSSLPRS